MTNKAGTMGDAEATGEAVVHVYEIALSVLRDGVGSVRVARLSPTAAQASCEASFNSMRALTIDMWPLSRAERKVEPEP